MPVRHFNPDLSNLGHDEDWEGNNAAFHCPVEGCGKVFIVSGTRMHRDPNGNPGYRKCPECQGSVGRVSGGRKATNGVQGTAWIEW